MPAAAAPATGGQNIVDRQMPALPKFLLLYAAMYAAYGVSSPFLPAFVTERGLQPEHLGFVLAAGTAIRLIAAPLAGRIADRLHALRMVLVVCIALAGAVTLGYLPAHGFALLLGLTLLHAAFLAPMTVLADALALGASRVAAFEYGWVRGAGSAAFIAGILLSGQLVGAYGLTAIIWSQALLLAAAALAATRIPELPHAGRRAPAGGTLRSEERRVGKECTARSASHEVNNHSAHERRRRGIRRRPLARGARGSRSPA